MGINAFLGRPPNRIEKWIKEHSSSNDAAAHVDFDVFSAALENSNGDTSTLPEVGTLLNVPYQIDHEADAVDVQWQIMGYNASIPEYVKYKSASGSYMFVRSVGEDTSLLRDIVVGCKVYSKTDDNYSDTGKTVSACGSETFTYGNNCTYSVPMTITVDGTTYTFCGYNVMLNMRHVLGVKSEGTVYYYPQFDTTDYYYLNGRNEWSTSQVRYWLNDTKANRSDWKWSGSNSSGTTTYSSSTALQTRFPSRVTDATFKSHIVPTVNRTWVYDDFQSSKTLDTNKCEHVIDKFWLLGAGNVNSTGANSSGTKYFYDADYDTSKFDEVYVGTDEGNAFPVYESPTEGGERHKALLKKEISIDGSASSIWSNWWLHSAHSSYSGRVTVVYSDGGIYTYNAYNSYGLSPACTIG